MPNDGFRIYAEVRDGVKYGIDIQSDIYKVLGLGYQSGYGYGDRVCCNEHGKINPWAKNKPVRTNELDTSDTTWQGGSDHKCGFSIPEYSAPGSLNVGLIEALASGAAQWSYLPPRAGMDWCRITDFDGYNHRAGDPFPKVLAGTINKQENGRVRIPISYGTLQRDGNLAASDFAIRGHDVSEWYLGVALWNSTKSYYAISENTGLNEMSLELPSIPEGTYSAATFISSVPMLAGEVMIGIYTSAGMLSVAEIEIKAYVPYLEATVSGDMIYGGSVVNYIATFYNRYPSAYTFRNVKIIVSEQRDIGGFAAVGSQPLIEFEVEGNGLVTKRGSVDITAPILGPNDTPPTYYIHVSWSGGSSDEVIVATTRPEI